MIYHRSTQFDDGTLTYSWDRGGRLLSAGGSSYEYNGFGQRLSQTVSAVVTDYLLDLQPGLSKVLTATTGMKSDLFVHALMLNTMRRMAGSG